MLDRDSRYYRQVALLIRLLPVIAREPCFALKGGTAINLFIRDLPRLSVDIDLVYLPIEDRETSLANVRAALTRMAGKIRTDIPGAEVQTAFEQSDALRVVVRLQGIHVKIELSPVLRGSVFPSRLLPVLPTVEHEFGYAEAQVLAFEDIYAGKIAAALDRQHPRDLFDIKLLLEAEGIDNNLRRTFLVYLISHHRPIAELLQPRKKEIASIFETEFRYMTDSLVTLEELQRAREQLVDTLSISLTDDDKAFLISFKSREPQWDLLPLPDIHLLPAVQWKLLNLNKMSATKHQAALDRLREVLYGRKS